MDAINAVEKEVDVILMWLNELAKNPTRDVLTNGLAECVEALRDELCHGINDITGDDTDLSAEQIQRVRDVLQHVKESILKLAADHRDFHKNICRLGKTIDQNFTSDYACSTRDDAFEAPNQVRMLNEAISQHFYRQGMQDIADELAKESGIQCEASVMEPFVELNHILDDLKNHNLTPAFAWAERNQTALAGINSSLEFKLHRLKFIDLINRGPQCEGDAVQYARAHLNKFVNKHENALQILMGTLLYMHRGLADSPYSYLLDPQLWVDVHETLIQDACSLMGFTVDSPLAVCINAGCKTIPSLINIKQVMVQRKVNCMFNGKDELPIEIDLGPGMRFHSVFACPILKQQTTENNPPMRLVCGHVISKEALNKLHYQNKLKCPYCPVEQMMTEARLIYF